MRSETSKNQNQKKLARKMGGSSVKINVLAAALVVGAASTNCSFIQTKYNAM